MELMRIFSHASIILSISVTSAAHESNGINKVKFFDADLRVLGAFANIDAKFMIRLGNGDLEKMRDPNNAQDWVKQNVQPST
ncbi:hypothetical protein ES319_A11G234500v1 [Gossypium barbadense]|uniref:Glucan endo-1,3-beta-D-glucosidase n=1 Tax=Gossypium barbadense TaxID=3634 RepID=A0A5J5TRS2_GOSBA|nr:hypothetical protein ES319_A11G234500v1 [Gossypium barbadense]